MTPRPLRIAEIAAASNRSPWFAEICAELARRGHDVVAVIDSGDGDLAARLDARGIRHHAIPLIVAKNLDRARLPFYLLKLPWAVLQLAAILRRERIDVAHSHIFVANLVTRLACALARIPHLASLANPRHLEAQFTRRIDRLTWRIASQRDDLIAGGCAYATQLCREHLCIPDERLAVVYYGARAEQFDPPLADRMRVRRELGIEDDTPLVGLIAHFYPPTRGPQTPLVTRGVGLKGHDTFVDAARIVTRRFPNARFVLVGSGSNELGERYRRILIDQSRDLGDRVLFTGHRDDLVDTIAALDVAVQCALSEGLGGTIEALLMARPTIATRVGGMPEAVRHEETGLLVEPANAADLAHAIERMLADRDEATRFGAAGRALMLERFTLARTGADLDALFQRLRTTRAGTP
ncbi:MAG TPA: glycosyltransferase [Thermoanaerobaculia bacterium]|nr:glycosyltransferase [Thermoanaerobaculia bacterium]